jgi:type I restriction enzyme S subunit
MEAVAEEIQVAKYPAYKDSGVEWLGEIPSHWETLANKYLFSLKKRLVGKESDNYVLLSLTLNGVIKRDMENPQGKFPAEFNTYQEVDKGDFIFCLFDVEETPRTVGLSKYDGMITGAYTVMQPNDNFDKGFLYYFYLNLDAGKRLKPLYTGLRNTISKENFFSFRTFVPPQEEQAAIARFLDRKTAQIDKAIGIKEKQIELLKERRQILIHNAVTRGLNPDAPMKDSGVEWIGQIPAHWEVKKLKYFAKVKSGDSIVNEQLTDEGEVEVFGGNGLMGFTDKYNVEGEKIIIGRVGAYCGNVRQINDRKWISDNALILILNEGESYNYFASLLSAANLNNLNTSSAQPLITGTKIMNYPLPIPPTSEQSNISEFIENGINLFFTTISLKEKEIEKLKEYKTSLINSAVTGKIKVSEV